MHKCLCVFPASAHTKQKETVRETDGRNSVKREGTPWWRDRGTQGRDVGFMVEEGCPKRREDVQLAREPRYN